LIPPGARHAVKGIGPGTSRVLVMLSPGHGEGFFREVEKEGLSPKDGTDRVNEIAAKYTALNSSARPSTDHHRRPASAWPDAPITRA
jgi:hypothetical protein